MLRKDFFDSIKTILIGLGAFVGIIFFIFIIASLSGEPVHNLEDYFIPGLFITGIIASGTAFKDFRTKEKTMSYIALPATAFEKLLSMLLLTTVGFIILYIAAFYLFSLLVILMNISLFGNEIILYNVFSAGIFQVLGEYIFIQSIFFAGAAAFRKLPLFKTLLAITIFGFIIALFTGTISFILFPEEATSYSNVTYGFGFNQSGFFMNGSVYDGSFLDILYTIIKYIFAPVLWTVAFFKLKEKEV